MLFSTIELATFTITSLLVESIQAFSNILTVSTLTPSATQVFSPDKLLGFYTKPPLVPVGMYCSSSTVKPLVAYKR